MGGAVDGGGGSGALCGFSFYILPVPTGEKSLPASLSLLKLKGSG